MFRSIITANLFLIAFAVAGISQTEMPVIPTVTPTSVNNFVPPPGDMQLLPGYVHVRKRGIDTSVGDISKPSGLTIRYDNGFLASNQAWMHFRFLGEKFDWYKEQKVNGLTLYLTRGKDGSIVATFPETCANFRAEGVNEEALTDFLLMIVTYHATIDSKKVQMMKDGHPTC